MEYSHCSEYEHLTMEEKLLVDMRMKKFFSDTLMNGLYGPMGEYHTVLKHLERNTIKILRQEKNNGR